MASEPVRSTAVVTAPKDYSIPAAQQIRLLSVRASFDGSGSASAWLPAVQILDNNGNVLVTAADPNVSVAAAGSADVSWFPGVKPRGVTSTTGGTPSVATFYTSAHSASDPPITVGAGATVSLTFAHAALPSNGSITGPLSGNIFVHYVTACMCIEFLYVGWDSGNYTKAAVLGTNSHIIQADMWGVDNVSRNINPNSALDQDWTTQIHPNAHEADDLVHAYAVNYDAVPHNVNEAWLVCYAWPAPGYSGLIPGWPA